MNIKQVESSSFGFEWMIVRSNINSIFQYSISNWILCINLISIKRCRKQWFPTFSNKLYAYKKCWWCSINSIKPLLYYVCLYSHAYAELLKYFSTRNSFFSIFSWFRWTTISYPPSYIHNSTAMFSFISSINFSAPAPMYKFPFKSVVWPFWKKY